MTLIYRTLAVLTLCVLLFGLASFWLESENVENQADMACTDCDDDASRISDVNSDNKTVADNPMPRSLRTDEQPVRVRSTSEGRRLFEWMMSIKGFDQTIPLSPQENGERAQ